jgi:6-pyruvoyltetrahydropterin/6-carboxytetrahydropterin synthase
MARYRYIVNKTCEFEALHVIQGLSERHPESQLHGHKFTLDITLSTFDLDEVGMILDPLVFDSLQAKVNRATDLGKILATNPTVELLAKYFMDHMNLVLLNAEAQDEVRVEKVTVTADGMSATIEIVP